MLRSWSLVARGTASPTCSAWRGGPGIAFLWERARSIAAALSPAKQLLLAPLIRGNPISGRRDRYGVCYQKRHFKNPQTIKQKNQQPKENLKSCNRSQGKIRTTCVATDTSGVHHPLCVSKQYLIMRIYQDCARKKKGGDTDHVTKMPFTWNELVLLAHSLPVNSLEVKIETAFLPRSVRACLSERMQEKAGKRQSQKM